MEMLVIFSAFILYLTECSKITFIVSWHEEDKFLGNRVGAIIPAAGSGVRMGTDIKKQYLILKDKPVIQHTIEKIGKNQNIQQVVVVCDQASIMQVEKHIISKLKDDVKSKVMLVLGGNTRTASVFNGVKALANHTDYVMIHDGVRPLIDEGVIASVIKEVVDKKAIIVGKKATDTIKIVKNNCVDKTIDRRKIWHAETPQCFEYLLIKDCLEKSFLVDHVFTDEASILEYFGYDVYIIENQQINLKITHPSDLEHARYIVDKRGYV